MQFAYFKDLIAVQKILKKFFFDGHGSWCVGGSITMNKQGAWQIVDNFLGLVRQSVTIVVNIPQWADSLVFNSKEYCIIHFFDKGSKQKH